MCKNRISSSRVPTAPEPDCLFFLVRDLPADDLWLVDGNDDCESASDLLLTILCSLSLSCFKFSISSFIFIRVSRIWSNWRPRKGIAIQSDGYCDGLTLLLTNSVAAIHAASSACLFFSENHENESERFSFLQLVINNSMFFGYSGALGFELSQRERAWATATFPDPWS